VNVRKTARNTRQKGFSLVELMMVLVITTIGFLAMINMQVGTLHAVNDTRAMMEAVNLAEHFIESLKSEAIAWNAPAQSTLLQGGMQSNFPHLRYVGPATTNGGSGWLEAYRGSGTDRRVSSLGNNEDGWDDGIVLEMKTSLNRRYCVHYRMTWLVPDYLIRADVRVLWLKDEASININNYQSCGVGTQMEQDFTNVGSVSVPGTIMRNIFAQ
jgi:prepilin-type N-terminal cleavage/methylation domain-containing protein